MWFVGGHGSLAHWVMSKRETNLRWKSRRHALLFYGAFNTNTPLVFMLKFSVLFGCVVGKAFTILVVVTPLSIHHYALILFPIILIKYYACRRG